MENIYKSSVEMILEELIRCLGGVDEKQAEALIEEILRAKRVFAIGAGRVLLMLQAFVKRLNHIGVEAYYVGAVNEPAAAPGDLLIVASGSGESAVPAAIAKVALKYKPKIAYVGSNMNSTIAGMADIKVRIPCGTKLNLAGEMKSSQPMSSLFEQSLLIFLDSIVCMIVKKQNIDIKTLWERHANLE